MVKKQNKQDDCPACGTRYPYHGTEIGRLNRAIGQIEGIKKMIEERRYCPEILTLLRGTRAALQSVEANILETYLSSCVAEAFASSDSEDQQQKIGELKAIFKRFEG